MANKKQEQEDKSQPQALNLVTEDGRKVVLGAAPAEVDPESLPNSEAAVEASRLAYVGDGDTFAHVEGEPGTWNTSGVEGGRPHLRADQKVEWVKEAQREKYHQMSQGSPLAELAQVPERREAEKKVFMEQDLIEDNDAAKKVAEEDVRYDLGITQETPEEEKPDTLKKQK